MLLYTSRGVIIGKADDGYPNYHRPYPTNSSDKPKEEDFITEKEFEV